tara:strand:+ start:912 stop:1112 length:201 start_codon:yes stop_codon:yes gene_type:complete
MHVGKGLSLQRSAEAAESEQDDPEGSADRLDGVHGSCGGVSIFWEKERLRAWAALQPSGKSWNDVR